MWTRLLYLQLPQALKAQKVNQRWFRPAISGRYRALLRKQFRSAGIEWIYDENKDNSNNPRHKQPKGHKIEKKQTIRLAKIKKLIENQEELEIKHRQDKMNHRKLTGIDYMIKQALPSWLSAKKDNYQLETVDKDLEAVKELVGTKKKSAKK